MKLIYSKVSSWELVVGSIFLLFLLLTPNSLLITPAFAHVLKTDGSIGAVLHIDPEDDPVAKQSASFFFEFKDTQNVFKLSNCDCEAFIYQGDKQLFTQLLTPSSSDSESSTSFSFTFPDKDIYQIRVYGKPNVYNQFNNFTLTYDVRVEKEASQTVGDNQTTPSWFKSHIPYLVGVGIVVLFLVFAVIKQRSNLKEIDKKAK